MTPDQELRAAAQRLRDLDDANWRGTPLHVLFPGVARLLDEYGDDWDQCPEDHPGTRLDDAALNLARKILGGRVAVEPKPVANPPAKPSPPAALRGTADGLVAHGDPIDIGWVGGSLDARLHLSVRPGMDPVERDQLLADLRDALGPVVPVRPAREATR